MEKRNNPIGSTQAAKDSVASQLFTKVKISVKKNGRERPVIRSNSTGRLSANVELEI